MNVSISSATRSSKSIPIQFASKVARLPHIQALVVNPFGLKKKKIKDQDSPLTMQQSLEQGGSSQMVPTPKPASKARAAQNLGFSTEPLADPKDANFDVVFVHGLMGNKINTWTSDTTPSCFWPADLLPAEIPNARILAWGYDANIVDLSYLGFVSTNDQEAHAINLCNDLTGERNNCKDPNRPIVFVCHSLGGLVCIRSILYSDKQTTKAMYYLSDVSKNTRGIVFMGTPHRGSSTAKLADTLIRLVGLIKNVNPTLTEDLKKDTPHLERLSQRFQQFLKERDEKEDGLKITCFHEELPTSMRGLQSRVVLQPFQAASNMLTCIDRRAEFRDTPRLHRDGYQSRPQEHGQIRKQR